MEGDQDGDLALAALHPDLVALARRLTRNAADADDLVQDTVERGMRKADHFRRGTNLRLWLYTVMRNLFYDRCRKRQREPASQPIEQVSIAAAEPDATPLWADVSDETFQRALHKLGPELRAVFELHAVENLAYAQIGERLGIPVATVGTRLFRARQKLRNELLRELGDRDEEALS